MTEMVGWLSSLVLLATLTQQIWKQWRERSTKGVSKFLFIGQTIASTGFTVYSWLVENWVFVFTNSLVLVSALVGSYLTYRFRARASTVPPTAPARSRASSAVA